MHLAASWKIATRIMMHKFPDMFLPRAINSSKGKNLIEFIKFTFELSLNDCDWRSSFRGKIYIYIYKLVVTNQVISHQNGKLLLAIITLPTVTSSAQYASIVAHKSQYIMHCIDRLSQRHLPPSFFFPRLASFSKRLISAFTVTRIEQIF